MGIKVTNLPVLTAEQMREVDRLLIEKYNINLIQTMENAGRNLADFTRKYLQGFVKNSRVLIVCGSGNNGGGGMVAARHLSNWGADVSILRSAVNLNGIPAHQMGTLQKLPINIFDNPGEMSADFLPDVIIDALLGFGINRNVSGRHLRNVHYMNASDAAVLSLDLPSGLHPDRGHVFKNAVKATATMTLALPKMGLLQENAQEYVGEIYVADIGVPSKLYGEMGIGIPELFKTEFIEHLGNPNGPALSNTDLFMDAGTFYRGIENIPNKKCHQL